MGMVVRRFEVWLCNLNPTEGVEIKKTRPCLIISPDEMNKQLQTAIIAPLTSKRRDWPSRISCEFDGKKGYVVLDQIRTIDKSRLVERLGIIDNRVAQKIADILIEMFSM